MAKLSIVLTLAGLLVAASVSAQETNEESWLEEIPDAEVESDPGTEPDAQTEAEAPVEAVPAEADAADDPEDAQPATADIAATIRAPEKPRGLARAELVTFQTAFGIGLGAEMCVLLECSEVRAWVGSVMLGASAGFGLSFWLSRDGVTHGQASSVNSGVVWGTVAGGFLAGAVDVESEKALMGTMIGLQLAGLAVGATFAALVRPPSGDVALTDAIALWTVGLTAMSFGAAEFDGETKVLFGALLGATAVGFGRWLSNVPVDADESRPRDDHQRGRPGGISFRYGRCRAHCRRRRRGGPSLRCGHPRHARWTRFDLVVDSQLRRSRDRRRARLRTDA